VGERWKGDDEREGVAAEVVEVLRRVKEEGKMEVGESALLRGLMYVRKLRSEAGVKAVFAMYMEAPHTKLSPRAVRQFSQAFLAVGMPRAAAELVVAAEEELGRPLPPSLPKMVAWGVKKAGEKEAADAVKRVAGGAMR